MTPSDLAAIRDRLTYRLARWEWGAGEWSNVAEALLEHVEELEALSDWRSQEACGLALDHGRLVEETRIAALDRLTDLRLVRVSVEPGHERGVTGVVTWDE